MAVEFMSSLAEIQAAFKRKDFGDRNLLEEALAIVRRDQNAFWDWFLTLKQEERENGSLVGNILWRWKGPLPKRAFDAMVRAALEEPCCSYNKVFVEPLLRSYGREATIAAFRAQEVDVDPAKQQRIESALYWARGLSPETPESLERMAQRLEEHAKSQTEAGAEMLREQAAKRRERAERMKRDAGE